VQTAAEAALKDLVAKEKEEVGLQERKKHATTKAKKLKKSLTDVSRFRRPVSVIDIDPCSHRTRMPRTRLSATLRTVQIKWRRRKQRSKSTKLR
jgi:hypothetical protein